MRVAMLAPLWFTIPPKGFGGTERVIYYVCEGLSKLGHDVTLFAVKGSKITGKVAEVTDEEMFDVYKSFDFTAIKAYEFLEYHELLRRIDDFDIVHNHLGLHTLALAPAMKIPIVTTYHSSIEPDFPYLAQKFKNYPFVSVSDAQQVLAPYLNWVGSVHNPIALEEIKVDYKSKGEYLLFIGAIMENKGLHLAVQAARELGEKLVIGGRIVFDKDKEYFETKIKPYVDGTNIVFLGEVNDAQKPELFAKAKAFMHPTQWHDACPVVVVESMAYGIPVVAYANGGLPELVEEGISGYTVNNYEDFKSAITRINKISRTTVRKYAEEMFSDTVIAAQYLEIYTKLISKNRNENSPRSSVNGSDAPNKVRRNRENRRSFNNASGTTGA